jgi:hypothetical protein
MANDEDFVTTVGAGGETHQHVPRQGPHDTEAHLTNNQGRRWPGEVTQICRNSSNRVRQL